MNADFLIQLQCECELPSRWNHFFQVLSLLVVGGKVFRSG